MAKFFIDRPIFAWVIALFVMVLGAVSITKLPVSQYPSVAPPSIVVSAAYPGASAQTLEDSVLAVIEREMNGAPGLAYMEAVSQANGTGTLTLSFEPGTNPDLAQVEVQNRLSRASPRLPAVVNQQGVRVDKSQSNFLLFTMLSSSDPKFDVTALSDYAARNVVPELQRVPGIGQVQLFGAERAMRVWVDPAKLQGFNLSAADVASAIQAQNAQVSAGSLGELPNMSGQSISATVVVPGQISSTKEFGDIVLRANADGSTVRLKDVARIELGAQSYATTARLNGKPATGMGVQLSPSGNALAAATAVKTRMAELEKYFPPGMSWTIPYDSSEFVKISIKQVAVTLLEAIVLVFLVMYLFLQNFRYTVIPTIVVPVALLGTFGALLAMGFSINVLTMFGMVLAIGIIVDDAIVVIENVERIMATEGLSPVEATSKAMKEITNPIIGITLVLAAVFLPMALASGSVGIIYRQFTITMSVSILFSAFLALTLTPALCATMLKPIDQDHQKKGVFASFDRSFEKLNNRYERSLFKVIKHKTLAMLCFLGIVIVLIFSFKHVPTAFMPEEDQGWFMTSIQLPADATQERTRKVVAEFQNHLDQETGIKDNMAVLGFGFSGSGQNTAMYFTNLLPFEERTITAQEVVNNANIAMAESSEGQTMSVLPPAIDELGNSSGFSLRLLDRGNIGMPALREAQDQLLALAAQSKIVAEVYPEGLPDGSSVQLKIDRDKLQALGVNFSDVTDIISTSMGSMYINDFPNHDRMQQVIVQLDAKSRMSIEDILQIKVNSQSGKLVSMSEIITPIWQHSPQQYNRYNGRPSLSISGSPAAGISSGQAMTEMENLIKQLPKGVGYEWTGISLEEKQSESQTLFLLLLSMLVVFLVLAALYESWSIPFSVMLVVPLGLIGAFLAVMLRGMPNDIFFKVGMITIIGLSAKNAILIVEFAKALREEGMGLVEATVAAAKLRLRPILMTSLAFTCGVIPLVIASGASSETQKAIGTGVFGGMISATILAVIFVPIFFIVVMSMVEKFSKRKAAH